MTSLLAGVILLIIIDQPSQEACGAAIMDYQHMGDVLCQGMEDEPSLAPTTSLIPKPRPQVKK